MLTAALLRTTLASARSVDTTNSNMALVMSALAVIAVSAALGFVLVRLGVTRRRPRQALIGLALVWALAADASVITHLSARAKWQEESQLRLESGFYDPATDAPPPARPLTTWAALATAYVALAAYAGARGRTPPT